MAQIYPIDIVREFERRWERRSHAAAPRVPRNDNRAGDAVCPVCKGYAAIGPLAGEYCGKGLLRRHWRCRACGHQWATVLHVLT